jgi:hypothetical protein
MVAMSHIYKMQHPEIFQGRLQNKHYFEGWYFKIIDADVENIYAFIVGISLDKKTHTSHAFIQFFNATERCAYYFKYPVEDFSASPDAFEIHIGPNLFSLQKIVVNIDQDGQQIQGELTLSDLTPLPKEGIGHGIMAVASYVPKLECRHAIISLDHHIQGSLAVNGEEKDFTGGKGYLEKDWGTSFPFAYIWMQTNHFGQDGMPLFGMKVLGL